MTARLSWSIEKTRLVLTVTDGPKTSHYTITRNGTHEAQRATLAAVLQDMGGSVPAPAPQPVSVAPVALEGPVYEDIVAYANQPKVSLMQQPEQQPMTEEESLEELKRRAYAMAQKNLGFRNGDLPDDTATALSRMPAHERLGHNPGYPTLDEGGVTAVDGSFIDPGQFRAKPQFNLDNHED